MCCICVKPSKVTMPNVKILENMFQNNPHGAGFCYSKDGILYLHKGFMNLSEFLAAIAASGIDRDTPAIFHTRISTQAGINKAMTQPFPLTKSLDIIRYTDIKIREGACICHNGIIPLTSCGDRVYSDTALFITDYIVKIAENGSDLLDPQVKKTIDRLSGGHSRFAFLLPDGRMDIIGKGWIFDQTGNIFSNSSYKPRENYIW